MPITKYPFIRTHPNAPPRPNLPIVIRNPHTGLHYNAWGQIDTGADMCVIPSVCAAVLGHDLEKGSEDSAGTGSGPGKLFYHTTEIEICKMEVGVPDHKTSLISIPETQIAFMPGLQTVLLGVRDFLDIYILTVDYQAQNFSINT
jgi:hypothetical protein